jgi:hypothetical protein
MAELKKSSIMQVEAKPESQEDVYLTVPGEDLYDSVHPGVMIIGGSPKKYINGRWEADPDKAGTTLKFEAGKTYKVPASIAVEVQDRLNRFEKEQVRLLRPRTDAKSLAQVNSGTMWARQGAKSFSMDGVELSSLGDNSEKVIVCKW